MVNGPITITGANTTLAVEIADDAKAGVYTLAEATGGITGAFANVQINGRAGRLAYSLDGERIEYEVFPLATLFFVR